MNEGRLGGQVTLQPDSAQTCRCQVNRSTGSRFLVRVPVEIDKHTLIKRGVSTKFSTPALRSAGWDEQTQVREEVSFTRGRIILRGKLVSRGKGKRADYVLSIKPNIRLADIEAKANVQPVETGIQQALDCGETLEVPFAF